VCPFGNAFVDVPQGDLDHDNQLHSGGPSSTAAVFPAGVTAGTSLNPQVRPEGWWERNPAQLYGAPSDSTAFALRENEAHFQSECSSVGLCDRQTGTCDCFAGYEGSACQRTTCPNECSGHGVCRSQAEYLEISESDFTYGLWDAEKYQRCICDPAYDGVDCSQRLCPLGDDPLTTTGTQIGFNDGLEETGEVQYLDIRCPYNGDMVDPSVAIVYTDAATGAEYMTSYFDPTITTTANAAVVLQALKDLPNGILSDYIVDGVTMRSKVQSVSITALETNTFYRLTVTFDESLGDVPPLSGEAATSMICSGGAKVNTRAGDMQDVYENIAVIPIGDGPREYLKFRIQVIDSSNTTLSVNNASVFEYQVFDQFGDVLNDVDIQTHRPTATSGANLGVYDILTNAALFSHEAAKVGFVWEFGEGLSGIPDPSFLPNDFLNRNNATREDNLIYEIEYIVDPTFTSHNQRFMLTGFPIGFVRADNNDAHNLTIGAPADTSPTYDIEVELEILESDHSPMAVSLNGEFVAYVNNSIAVHGASNVDIFAAIATGFDGVVPTNGADFIGPANVAINTTERTTVPGDKYSFFLPKTPITVVNTGSETVQFKFSNNNAPVEDTVTIVIKIVQTSSAVDRYMWKVAGDAAFVDSSNTSLVGFPISTNFTLLGEANLYAAMHPDDPIRSTVDNLSIFFPQGPDFDERICATQSSVPGAGIYYVQIGLGGINDHNECSSRGICDDSTGMCSCFSGYAGLDCAEQNALAGGGGGSFAL